MVKSQSTMSGSSLTSKKKGNPLGEDFMKYQWQKPDLDKAKEAGVDSIWGSGERKFSKTSAADFGELSDGMALYFYVLKSFVVLFGVVTLLSLPLMVISNAGNDGMSMPEETGFPATMSLGNLGYNPDTEKATTWCRDIEGEHSCVSKRYVYGLEVMAKYVTYVVSGYEALICVVMIVASTYLVTRVEEMAAEIDDESSTPSDFTVFVRGLPKDVSEGALLSHFSMRYDLRYEQLEFPFMGYSVFGASLTMGFWLAVFFSIVAGGYLANIFGALGSAAAPVALLFLTGLFTVVLWLCNFGQAKTRLTPAQRWDEQEAKRDAHRAEMALDREKHPKKWAKKASQVLPEPPGAGASEAQLAAYASTVATATPRRGCVGRCLGCFCPCCCGASKKTVEGEARDEDGLRPPTPRPDPQPVTSTLHNGYPPCLGSMVADLHIVYPNGKIIAAYKQQKKLLTKIEAMRSKVQMYKADTPHDNGPKPSKEAATMKKLDKLSEKMHKVHAKVAGSIKDRRKSAHCEGAFITFNHEESQRRCLEDYRASSGWFAKAFQPKHLQFMWHVDDQDTGVKTQKIFPLRVEQAPEPSDIFWENLTVTDRERSVRVLISNLITLTVLVLSFGIALSSSRQTKLAAESLRSTNNCDDLPSIWYGRYYNRTAGDLWVKPVTWVRNETLDERVCGGSRKYIVNAEFDLDAQNLPGLKPSQPYGDPYYPAISRPPKVRGAQWHICSGRVLAA